MPPADGSSFTRPAPEPTHLQGNARSFLRSIGYRPSEYDGDRSAKGFLHDNALHCDNCDDWFSSRADMAEKEDQPEFETWCWFCRWNYSKPGEQVLGRAA